MVAHSLRAYLELLDERDGLNRITADVSWNLEASAITMAANEADGRIPIFESVIDSNTEGARLVGDPYRGSQARSWDRLAMALGLPRDQSSDDYYDEIIRRLQSPIQPTTIDRNDAACKEITNTTNPDLFAFPWPFIHAGDGGRYSNLQTVIASDPDSSWRDWSYHRTMIHDGTKASLLFLAGEQTPNLYYYKYERRDEAMPVAIAVGAEPAVECASVMWIPTGKDEAQYAGGLKEEPVELVACETNDLLVPANAELIIEGRVVPDTRLDEGPFGEYFGYMHGPRRSMPVLHVDAITHRADPILPFCVEGSGTGYTENTTSSREVACVGPDATLGLRAAGFDVTKLAPWPFIPRTVYAVATDSTHPGHLHDLANFIFTTWGMLHIDFFIFVDSDIDPLNTRAVLEAITTHADPTEDFHQFGVETMPKVPLNIYQTPEEKGNAQTGTSKAKTAKAYIDATRSDESNPDEASSTKEQAQAILSEAGMESNSFDLVENDA
jgi:UbiD family decarboxylase